MNTTALTCASWPSDPDLTTRRWPLQLLAGLTDEIAALSHGHRQLTRLLQHPDPLPPDTRLADALHTIDQTIVSPTHNPTRPDLARPHHPDIHQLLHDASRRRTNALTELRRLITPVQFASASPLTINHHHLRPMLGNLLAHIDHTGRILTRADGLLIRELTDTANQPTTRPDNP